MLPPKSCAISWHNVESEAPLAKSEVIFSCASAADSMLSKWSHAVVVMAGDPDYERTAAAVALMRRENVATLILTGGEPGPGDSAESLRTRAIALGVPETRIHIESVSHSTREAVLAVAPILQSIGARTATVVTSPYHQRRATAAARRAWPGVVVRARAAAPSAWRPERWWATAGGRRVVVSEYAKLLYYGVRGWL